MDFELSADQRLLVETAANFVRKESPITRARQLRDDPLGFRREAWKRMGDMGWLGIPFSEEDGGYGGSFVDVTLILEQLGTTLVPEPYLASVILAGGVLARAASPEQKAQFLAPMIAGDTTLALAYAERGGRYDVNVVSTRAEASEGGYLLTGEKIFVLNGHAAEHLVVSARTSGATADRGGVSLFVVDRETPGVTVRPIQLFDGRRGAAVSFAGARVGAERRLGVEGEGLAVLERVIDEGAAAACAEAVGLVRTVLFMTCDYLRTREQFGVKIGSFQALQHRAVDMFVESELLKSTALMASLKVSEEDAVERQSALSAAKVQAAVSGRFVTQQSIQLHGGIGVTDEHDVGLYFKRLQVLLSLFGDEDYHLARYASLPSFTAGVGAGLKGSTMAEERLGYAFEEIGDDLLRPPMAALRALQSVGVIVAPKGWQAIELGARRTLAIEGARDRVDMMVVREIINQVPANQIKLVSRVVDPDPSKLPEELAKVLGPARPIAIDEWAQLRPLDRFMLTSLSYNTRLLWRALDELVQENRLPRRRVRPWTGAVATCELRMRSDVMATLLSTDFLEGRAFVLARGSGRRAARKASELFDLQAELAMGPIELDWGASDTPGVMFWQAHASSWDGAFSPAASIAAAVNAAIAILDMLKDLDPKVTISRAGIVEEAWVVGQDGGVDATTKVFSKPPRATDSAPPATPPPAASVPFALDTIVDPAPAWAAAAREPEKAPPPARASARVSSPVIVERAPEREGPPGKALIRIPPDAAGNSAFAPAATLPPNATAPRQATAPPRVSDSDPVELPMRGKNPWFWVSILLLVGLTGPVAFLVYERLARGP